MRLRAILLAPLVIFTFWLAGPGTAQATPPTYPAPGPVGEPTPIPCEKPNHYYANLLHGGYYYHCDRNGQATIRACARGTVFHERIQVCDWARNVPESRIRGGRLLVTKPATYHVAGGSITGLSATVAETGTDGEPIVGTGVTFSTKSGKLLCKATTDDQGVASCAPDSNLLGSIGNLLRDEYLAASTTFDSERNAAFTHAVPGKLTTAVL